MAAEGKIDPMHQFTIERIAPLHIGPYDISFTNSAAWMLVFLIPAEVRRYFILPLLADRARAESPRLNRRFDTDAEDPRKKIDLMFYGILPVKHSVRRGLSCTPRYGRGWLP